MLNKDLIALLQKFPPNAPVVFNGEGQVELELNGHMLRSRVVDKVVGVHQVVLTHTPYRPPTKGLGGKRARMRKLRVVMINPTLKQIDDWAESQTAERLT